MMAFSPLALLQQLSKRSFTIGRKNVVTILAESKESVIDSPQRKAPSGGILEIRKGWK